MRRLAYAQWAEEKRGSDNRLTFKEIAKAIDWPHGTSRGGVKLLEDARKRLARCRTQDPTAFSEAMQLLAQLKARKETKETT